MTLSPGARLGPYEIVSLLGKGGMGEVWRGRDTRIDRPVALKVLPQDFLEGEERRERFGREARLLASLNHPGIATLYSFEEIAGRNVLSMELVEGDDLAGLLSAGPLTSDEIRSYGRQIAEALAAAHEKGIVHRDLKPANVRIAPGGRVKLLDFGLAKSLDVPPVGSEDATAAAALSEAGVVMGTVPYMSPEQVTGRPLDARSDLFSLGIVLYEMAAGRRPFAGASSAEIASAILRDTPPPVGRVRADLPDALSALIARCLEKDPRDRVPSARDALATFDAPRGAGPAPVSIAVLPFADMSAAKDQDWLCEGMAEEVMNALVGAGLHVAARTSSFRAARLGDDLPAIARALNVGHVLEGSVRTVGPRMRVTARLTDASSGFQLWSQTFDRETADVFSVQDEIAAGVVEAVESRLGVGRPALHARPPVRSLEAYQQYLMGRHLRYTKNDHGGALRAFGRALALDPAHAPSWVGVAEVSVLAATYGLEPPAKAYADARAALATAERLQGETGDALYVEGLLAVGERRWTDGLRAALRATNVEPGHVAAACWLGMFQCIEGRTEDALETLRRARGLDPLSPYPYGMTGMCLLEARRWQEAQAVLEQALALDAANSLALWVSGAANVALRRFDLAVEHMSRAQAPPPRVGFIAGALGWALAAAGRLDEARRILADLRSRPAPAPALLSEAWLLAELGERDAAFMVLDRTLEEKSLIAIFTGLPGFDPLRADPRFEAFVSALGLPVPRR